MLFRSFSSADTLDSEKWDARTLADDADLEQKDKIAYLAFEFAIEIFEKGH